MGSPLTKWHADHGAEGTPLPLRYGPLASEIAAVRSRAGLIDLSHLPAITITSPDAKRWCNGMFTNNIRKLTSGQGNRSAMCDDRGRVQGLIDLYCTSDEDFFGVLDGVELPWFQKRYGMFMVLDDIELESCEDEIVVLSLQGPTAGSLLTSLGLPTPEADHGHEAVEHNGATLRIARRDRTGSGGFDLFVTVEGAQSLWQALIDAGATAVGQDALNVLRIQNGRARWPQDGTAKSMVHELRFNEECCAFDKGCYVGQEVINRIDVKGGVVKRLTGLRFSGSAPLGAVVNLGGKRVGWLTSAVELSGQGIGLAVLRKTAWEVGTEVTIEPEDGAAITATVADFPL